MTSRRQFLRGRFAARHVPLRPPWALGEDAFLAACTRCGDCVRACPQGILVDEGGYPRVEFGKGECTFCGECVAACKPAALRRAGDRAPWQLLPLVGDACLARHNVMCRSCGDACAALAIRFRPQVGGAALPEVDPAACTGCGACVASCPPRTIEMRRA